MIETAEMTAIEFLKEFPFLPTVLVRGEGKTLYGRPSNSELKRWLINGSVIINGVKPKPSDNVAYPIKEFVFFPDSKHRVTLMLPDKIEEASDLIKRYYK